MGFDHLKTSVQKAGKTQPWTMEKRKPNIDWIASLDRTGLESPDHQRQLFLHRTAKGEEVFIQYPGIESSTNPWDFRPKLRSASGVWWKDLTFFNIWDALLQWLPAGGDTQGYDAELATLFYRMAFMLDHEPKVGQMSRCIDVDSHGKPLGNVTPVQLPTYHAYSLPELGGMSALTVHGITPATPEVSLEGFLVYNDLLAWNEDCKYYHRALHPRKPPPPGKKPRWLGNGVGRVNTLLTHVNVIGVHMKVVPLAQILEAMSRSRGVAPVNPEKVRDICKPYLD